MLSRFLAYAATAGASFFSLAMPAFAQTPTGSTAANPAVAAQRAGADLFPARSRSIAAQVPTTNPIVGLPPSIPRPAAGTSKPGPSFQVSSITFEGNKAIAISELAALAKPLEGSRQTLAALRTLTESIQALYRSRGYFLARAILPAQELTSGNVRVAILEGNFGETRIEGNRHYSKKFIDRFFAPARRSGVIQEGPVTRSLLILNELQDLQVQSVIQRGTKPGTTDIVLKVTDQTPWHVAVDYNNYGNRLVGQNRVGLAADPGDTSAHWKKCVACRFREPRVSGLGCGSLGSAT